MMMETEKIMTRTMKSLLLGAGFAAVTTPALAEAGQAPDPASATAAEASGPPASASPAEEDAPTVRFKGAPEFTAPGGWSFKPRGRIQYDAGHVSRPDGLVADGLGFSNELRRARLGVEGDVPGGFGYVFEIDFAGGEVEITDAMLTYDASDAVKVTLGQHNNFQSLEELSSSRFSSFIERAAFTDAFGFERRAGLSMAYSGGDFLAQGGVFTDNVHDLDDGNDSISLDGRLVYSPKLGNTQLHIGGSLHWRDVGDSIGTSRYRQRPLIHSTDVRFVATPALPVDRETSYGLEAAIIHGPFHAVGEVHWLEADTIDPGPSPTFFGGYAEIGYFLTGETRGYKGGKFDRTRPNRSIEEGGIGAFQVNLRYDHLDLNSDGIVGGTQNGIMASLVWVPTDHVRFMINYAHLDYDDAAIPAAGGRRSYGVDVIGARAQIDF